jgi:hypothetical protein
LFVSERKRKKNTEKKGELHRSPFFFGTGGAFGFFFSHPLRKRKRTPKKREKEKRKKEQKEKRK